MSLRKSGGKKWCIAVSVNEVFRQYTLLQNVITVKKYFLDSTIKWYSKCLFFIFTFFVFLFLSFILYFFPLEAPVFCLRKIRLLRVKIKKNMSHEIRLLIKNRPLPLWPKSEFFFWYYFFLLLLLSLWQKLFILILKVGCVHYVRKRVCFNTDKRLEP